jgi:hypothetical protein
MIINGCITFCRKRKISLLEFNLPYPLRRRETLLLAAKTTAFPSFGGVRGGQILKDGKMLCSLINSFKIKPQN